MSRKNRERRIANRAAKAIHFDEIQPVRQVAYSPEATKKLQEDIVEICKTTPSSRWHAQGEPDPHGTHYDCERAQLTMGDLTDDELANGIFMNYDVFPRVEDVIDRKAWMPIVWMTAGKERIRWLSRALESAQETIRSLVRDQIKIELDQDDPDPVKTIDVLVKAYIESRQSHFPVGKNIQPVSNVQIPEGYALVPKLHEGRAGLTDTMMRAFYKAFEENSQRGDFERLNAAYNTMVAVAPDAPAVFPLSQVSEDDPHMPAEAAEIVRNRQSLHPVGQLVPGEKVDSGQLFQCSTIQFAGESGVPIVTFYGDGSVEISDTTKLDEAAQVVFERVKALWFADRASFAVREPIQPTEDEWEYETKEYPRKGCVEFYPPDGEGWERDYSRGRPGEAWDRFDNHEEVYWKRLKPKA
jgi:hypothetical protein